ncbi:hypothetical protein CMO91_03505 [Candidatus Woesearchaeota archaeon]|jgi:predicted nucleic acid-binding protein|nr:hypothetical protein [Candidatus Woesearchaeota archaeon]|tara:strand:- start:401 stop:820 length:420 start_codon:yes stop_codon:yes gene_type:complete
MRVVLDTNILFGFFWKRSGVRTLVEKNVLSLAAPKIALIELRRYKSAICKKANITPKQFLETLKRLPEKVFIVDEEEYAEFMEPAKRLCPDPDDVAFFALALAFDRPLWTNDRMLDHQSKLRVFHTTEMAEVVVELQQG